MRLPSQAQPNPGSLRFQGALELAAPSPNAGHWATAANSRRSSAPPAQTRIPRTAAPRRGPRAALRWGGCTSRSRVPQPLPSGPCATPCPATHTARDPQRPPGAGRSRGRPGAQGTASGRGRDTRALQARLLGAPRRGGIGLGPPRTSCGRRVGGCEACAREAIPGISSGAAQTARKGGHPEGTGRWGAPGAGGDCPGPGNTPPSPQGTSPRSAGGPETRDPLEPPFPHL